MRKWDLWWAPTFHPGLTADDDKTHRDSSLTWLTGPMKPGTGTPKPPACIWLMHSQSPSYPLPVPKNTWHFPCGGLRERNRNLFLGRCSSPANCKREGGIAESLDGTDQTAGLKTASLQKGFLLLLLLLLLQEADSPKRTCLRELSLSKPTSFSILHWSFNLSLFHGPTLVSINMI